MTPVLTYLDAAVLTVVVSAISFMAGRFLHTRSIEREVRARIGMEAEQNPYLEGSGHQ